MTPPLFRQLAAETLRYLRATGWQREGTGWADPQTSEVLRVDVAVKRQWQRDRGMR